jgi:hypothetical protein
MYKHQLAAGLFETTVDVTFSHSLVESWWRSLKHGWLYLNRLNSVVTLRRRLAQLHRPYIEMSGYVAVVRTLASLRESSVPE